MRPDARWLTTTRLSGAPLTDDEIDYDELDVLRSWRAWDEETAGAVRYFMYELGQRNPGMDTPVQFFKAVRFLRLTRVPRWLRQQGSGTGRAVSSQMAYILAALREQGVLFCQIVAKTPEIPLIYAYGVQAIAYTPEEAQARCDEAYATLQALLDGTFQQIEHSTINMEEAEALARYQATWRNVAVARGRPMPSSDAIGASSILDGNRTDMEQTHNQMEAFIRGLSESNKGFMLTLVTAPISVDDMTLAWGNLTKKLSVIRSETYGTKAFNAGVALPLSVGTSGGQSHSDSHSSSATNTAGTSQSVTVSDGHSRSESVSVGDSHTHSQGTSLSHTDSASESRSLGHGQSLSDGVNRSTSTSESQGLSEGRSLTAGTSVGTNQSQSVSDAFGASTTRTDGFSASHGTSLSQGSGYSSSIGDSASQGTSTSNNSNVSGAPLGFGGGLSRGDGTSTSAGTNTSVGMNSSVSSGSSSSTGTSSSMAQGLTQTTTAGESWGTSQSQSLSDARSLSATQSLTAGQSLGSSRTAGTSLSESLGTGTSRSVGTGATESVSSAQSRTQGVSQGTSSTQGTSTGQSASSALSDAYAVATSRQAASTGSLGVVPSFGVSIAKQTLDQAKKEVGDLLEATLKRYTDGIEGGAYLYQMFLVTEDRETLVAASALLKSAFWAPGTADQRLAQPFHVVTDFSAERDPEGEVERLLTHARVFSAYRKREPVIEIIEPFKFSSYATVGELSAFCRPPVAEGPGLLAVHDSAPVLAMPADRQHRELTLGRLFNGERARVSKVRWGVDADELTHVLISGTTGSGKTTTLNGLLAELTKVSRTITARPAPGVPPTPPRTVYPSILALDWMANMRHLGSLVEPVGIDPTTGERTGRFQFFSVAKPELGAFRWNPLEVPDETMNPTEWLNAMADNMVASWGLGEFGRSLIAEAIDRLYAFDRLEPQVLLPERTDELGNVTRPAIMLDAVDAAMLPDGAVALDPLSGRQVANVYTCPRLSRLIGLSHLATLVLGELERAATVEGGRQGTSLRDRLQSLWRRVSYFAPGGQLSDLASFETDLDSRTCLSVDDIVDPDRGLITVIETEGLDLANRRFILGSLLLAVYRTGLHRGEGCFNQHGQGVGLFLVLEEAHELFGSTGEEEDGFSASTRTALYESMHRRIRALGARLIDVVQNPGDIPEAITSNINTVFIHRAYAEADRKRIFNLLNWSNMIGQQLREFRWLGEMPVGYCIARLHARGSYLESAPVQVVVDLPAIGRVTDEQLLGWAQSR
jgi:DNA helicase HerA-like ATPase